ncbi:MAG: DUF192 domain-containing protein [Nitrospira sp.]|nr:DUF192 domain-containing protein [Nitrospira sp.]MEB2339531.1 DUF192 domain-containing protein [Nitrospirales bacterium]QOJ35674.1 MAG: DUF192 domain-containing protein [Nitrospira sp.]
MVKKTGGSESDPRRKKIVTLVLLVILLFSVAVFLGGPKESEIIIVEFPNGKTIETEVASTPEKLLFGLAFREGLPADTGMLYIFESTGLHRVRTRQFRFAVDMLWVDESHHIVQILEGVPPCAQDPCPLYGPPPEPVRYLIEANAGYVKQAGITTGMELKFTLRM